MGVIRFLFMPCLFRYVAGYIAKVANEKFKCNSCKTDLINEQSDLKDWDEMLILNRSYATKDQKSHLTAPTEEFTNIVNIMLTTFQNTFDEVKHLSNVKQYIIQNIKQELNKENRGWLKEGEPCNHHRNFIMSNLVVLKIHKTVKWFSKEMQITPSLSTSEYTQKLKNLHNQ